MVNEELLRESGLVRGKISGIKILGDGDLKHALKIEADKVSDSAREKIEKAGWYGGVAQSRPGTSNGREESEISRVGRRHPRKTKGRKKAAKRSFRAKKRNPAGKPNR